MSDCDSWDGHNKVHELATTLQDANRNLRAVDRMLGEYREVTDRPTVRDALLHTDDLNTSQVGQISDC